MIFGFDDIEFNAETLELRRDGTPVRADALVLRVLAMLLENAGELVTKERLVAGVWGGRAVSENVVTVAMARLRKALGAGAESPAIATVHGRGYRFARPVSLRDGKARPRFPSDAPVAVPPPFVGREKTLQHLRAVLADAHAGRGSVCALLGEGGIGKTRAVEVLEDDARSLGFVVAWGHCREAGDTPPLWPFVQLVRGALGALRAVRGEDDPRLARALAELQRLVPDFGAARDGVGDGVRDGAAESGAETQSYRVFDAIAHVVTLLAEQHPCLFVLDDLHRADSASLAVMRYFIDQIAHTRVAIFATVRTGTRLEPTAKMLLSYVLGHRNASRLVLPPLDASEVGRYVAAVVDDPDGACGRSVFAKSEGNPFLMTELSRVLRDRGPSTEPLAVPALALELLRQRIATVDERARGALSAAAVIGRVFDLPTLEAVTGAPARELALRLDDAVEREVIVAPAGQRTAFAFAHDQLRAVLYEQLPMSERRRLHLRVVEALETRAARGGEVPPADLAYHACAALPDGEARKAVRFCVDSAVAAARRRAYADGVRALGQALEALDLVPNPSARFRLGLLLQRSLYARVTSAPGFEAIVQETIRVARTQGAVTVLARAALLLDVHPGLPAVEGARAVLEDALSRTPAGDEETRASLLGRLVTSGPRAYDAATVAADLAEAASLARKSGSLLARYVALTATLYARGGPGHEVEAALAFTELDALCREHPDTLSVTPVLLDLHRAVRAARQGDAAEGVTALLRAQVLCRQLGHLELLWHVERFLLLLRAGPSLTEESAAELESLHRRAEREAIASASLYVAYDLAVVLERPEDPSLAAHAHALTVTFDEPPGLWATKVRTLAALGRCDDARRALRARAPESIAALPRDRDYIGTLGMLYRAALSLSEMAYAEALGTWLAPHAALHTVGGAFHDEGTVAATLASSNRRIGRSLERSASAREKYAV